MIKAAATTFALGTPFVGLARCSGVGISQQWVQMAENAFSDFQLMAAIATGDRGAISRLYDKYSAIMFRVCQGVLRDRHEAEEVLIEVFMELWEKSVRYDAARGTPLTYLLRLSKSRAIDRYRNLKSHAWKLQDQLSGFESVDLPPSAESDSGELRARLHGALSERKPTQREVVESAFFEGLSHAEIAVKMNRPLGTVKTQIRQGLRSLQLALLPFGATRSLAKNTSLIGIMWVQESSK